jgi:hypothetical protein
LGGTLKADSQLKQRTLAGPVWTDKTDHVPKRQSEIQLVERPTLAVATAKSTCFNRKHD